MKMLPIFQSNLVASPLVLGMMRIAGLSVKAAEELTEAALACGINHVDHADIYGAGQSEALFGQVLKAHPQWRRKLILQSKCGIVPGQMYDFSKTHILESVEGSLRRLGQEQLDVLLLHRPDALMEPEEVADAFDTLQRTGKVRYFGLSNHTPYQIELLKTCVKQPLIINQIQLGLGHTLPVDPGLRMNTALGGDNAAHILPYCQLNRLTLQAWSPFRVSPGRDGLFSGAAPQGLSALLEELAQVYGVTPNAIALSWILRLPGSVQTVIGTTRPQRIKEMAAAANITLTRAQWYALYQAAGHPIP